MADPTSRKGENSMQGVLEKGLISMGIIVASTLAGPVWLAFAMNGAVTYYQDLDASLFGFLVGIVLVLTALLARMK